MPLRWRRARDVAGGLVVAMGLAGCGHAKEIGPSSDASVETPATSDAAADDTLGAGVCSRIVFGPTLAVSPAGTKLALPNLAAGPGGFALGFQGSADDPFTYVVGIAGDVRSASPALRLSAAPEAASSTAPSLASTNGLFLVAWAAADPADSVSRVRVRSFVDGALSATTLELGVGSHPQVVAAGDLAAVQLCEGACDDGSSTSTNSFTLVDPSLLTVRSTVSWPDRLRTALVAPPQPTPQGWSLVASVVDATAGLTSLEAWRLSASGEPQDSAATVLYRAYNNGRHFSPLATAADVPGASDGEHLAIAFVDYDNARQPTLAVQVAGVDPATAVIAPSHIVADGGPHVGTSVSIAADPRGYWLAYNEEHPGGGPVYVVRLGRDFTPLAGPTKLDVPEARPDFPSIASDGDHAAVAWTSWIDGTLRAASVACQP